MGFLIFLILVGLLIYLVSKPSSNKPPVSNLEDRLSARNQEWITFIHGYYSRAKSQAERKLLDSMLDDINSKGLMSSTTRDVLLGGKSFQSSTPKEDLKTDSMDYEVTPRGGQVIAATRAEPQQSPSVQLDNASLLLYFGAFLFVASVGLFIAFGSADGGVRTLAVLLVMAVLYGGGQWVFKTKPKLEQAGLAFVGMGMAIAPLAGVAAYYYLFGQTQGPIIWFITSLLCMGMYAHALITLRRPLVSYLLIFTFLSLFESGVSIIDAPIYYFGWAMALTGIILSLVSRLKGYWPELQESSRASSAVFLPLALFASLSLVAQHGITQFGISLLIAAAYYLLETLNTKDESRQMNAIVAQLTTISGIAVLTFGATDSWTLTAISLLVMCGLQLAAILLWQKSPLSYNFATVTLACAIISIFIGIQSPGVIFSSVAALTVLGTVVWIRQQRVDAFAVGLLAWMALPVVFGQVLLQPRMEGSLQTGISFSSLLLVLAGYAWLKPRTKLEGWTPVAQQLVLVNAVGVLLISFFAGAWVCSATAVAISLCLLLLAEYDKDSDWAVTAGLLVALPLLRIWEEPGALLTVNMLALVANMFIALRHRNEITRWFSTVLWLLLPVTLASNFPGSWHAREYAWSYVLVMVGLLLSRAIARGVVFRSDRIPLASFARTASQSYVVGYCTAGFLATVIALSAGNARLHATLILTVMALTVFVLGKWIEKRPSLYAALPLFIQAVLLSAMRPAADEAESYLVISIAVAAIPYLFLGTGKGRTPLRLGTILASLVAPASIFVIGSTQWPMPIGLFVAGCLVYFEVKDTTQTNRELAGSILVLAFMWLLSYLGVTNVQAYTHILAAMFAFYALWRASLDDREASDQYLYAMLATATIPLALQALAGQSGGLYGWWLLLEQVGFMLLGMTIGRRFVTFWGLYVAIAAVLYQLRNLGWAALTVLAMFLIGIAIYYLQKHSDNPPKN